MAYRYLSPAPSAVTAIKDRREYREYRARERGRPVDPWVQWQNLQGARNQYPNSNAVNSNPYFGLGWP